MPFIRKYTSSGENVVGSTAYFVSKKSQTIEVIDTKIQGSVGGQAAHSTIKEESVPDSVPDPKKLDKEKSPPVKK